MSAAASADAGQTLERTVVRGDRTLIVKRSARRSGRGIGKMAPLMVAGASRDVLEHRQAFDLRWLGATSLLGGIAGFLIAGALITALRPVMQVTFAEPTVVRYPVHHPELALGDRPGQEPGAQPQTRPAIARKTRVEQLEGSELRALTHVVVRLADVALAPKVQAPPDVPVPRDRPEPDDAADVIARTFGPPGPDSGLGRAAHGAGGLDGAVSAYAPTDIPRDPFRHKRMPNGARHTQDAGAPRGQAINVSTLSAAPMHAMPSEVVVVAKPGDVLTNLLSGMGLSDRDRAAIDRSLAHGGRKTVTFAGGEKIRFIYVDEHSREKPIKIAVERRNGHVDVVALRDRGDYVALKDAPARHAALATPEPAEAEPALRPIDPSELDGISVRDALGALSDQGVAPGTLADVLTRLTGHDISLDSQLTPDDTVDFVYGAAEGDQAPELLFASVKIGGTVHKYYRFEAPDDGSTDFYDDHGRSATQTLMRNPLPNGKFNNGFGWRIHPVLGDRRFHNGVDYNAPIGSPIVAAGAGVVEEISYEEGYGRYIRLRHDGGYETTYAHVEGFAKGLKVGSRVRQGQTIAYVGSTGYSTGPHLYYEVRVNGRYVDPLRIKLASGRVLSGNVLDTFQSQRRRIETLLKATASAQ